MVRREDERAVSLRAAGAQVVIGDLLEPGDVYRVVNGCRRVYFGMSVSAGYLEAAVTMAAVARAAGVNALVNMSQMTVSEMSIQNTLAMGELHRAGRYDRQADGVQRVTGRPTMRVREFVSLYAEKFGGRRS
jgi:uncharacterized protein YbjT (DUF2867 family)